MSRDFGEVGDVGLVDEDRAFVDLLETGEHAERGRLPAAGGPDENEEFAVLHLEVEAVHGGRVRARIDARGILIGHCGHFYGPFTGRYVPDDPL
ncbi:hypothetical protein GCM10029992_19130 [Glycomyces albus]